MRLCIALIFVMALAAPLQAAQLLIIKAETARDGLQYLGDVVGVFSDAHQFSVTELAVFNVLTVGGEQEDVQARLDQITPQVADAYRSVSGNYFWIPPDEPGPPDTVQVYRVEGSRRWYLLVNDFKMPLNIGALTPEEKQLLETVNINHPSVDSFIRKLAKDVAALSGNDVEVRDLRNTEPF